MAILTTYQKEALRYDKHISLTANAGSGKTFVLSKRFVEILINEDVSLNNIVAITFTEKAAAELYKKIAEEIDQRIEKESRKNLLKKLESLRSQLVSAKISTIHSFCADILKEFSPEAGIDANFIPIDRKTSDELIEASVEEVINDSFRKNSLIHEDLKKLIRLFGSRSNVAKQLKVLIEKRKVVEQLFNDIYNKDSKSIANYFHETFIDYFNRLFSKRMEVIIGEVTDINNAVKQNSKNNILIEEVDDLLNKYNTETGTIKKCVTVNRIFTAITTKNKPEIRKVGYIAKELRENYQTSIDNVQSFIQDFRQLNVSENSEDAELVLAETGKQLITFWEIALNIYEKNKRERSYVDFEDLLIFSRNLINREDVRSYLSDKYKYFMIDEYQDTNEIQYEIFLPLLDNLKQGNLFVVGDEKQSIYRFRDAELEIFSRTKNKIKSIESNSSLLELPHSFRVSPKITLFTNLLFRRLFQNPNIIFNEVKYSELICARENTDIGEIEFLISNGDDDSDSEQELIAKKIKDLVVNNNFNYNDFSVLARKRNLFAALEKTFVKYDIPYMIMGGKGFYQTQIIYDVFNYLSFLLDKKNDAALIGVLRAPFFLLSDLSLYEISLEPGETFFDKFQSYSSSHPELKPTIDILNNHLSQANKIQIPKLLRMILIDTGYWGVVSAKKNYKQELSNLEKLISTAIKYSGQGFRTLYDFCEYLEDAIKTLEDEGHAPILADDNSVKLMTIHASKGLEFKAVFLYGCNEIGYEDKVQSKNLTVDKKFGLLTKTPFKNNYFNDYISSPIAGMYNYVNSNKNRAELKRLLYVGTTRAEDYLYITATIKENKIKKGSFAELIYNGLGVDRSASKLDLKGNIKFMKEVGDKFEKYEEKIQINISVKNNFELSVPEEIKLELKRIDKKTIEISSLIDIEENEIISATKIAVYKQCPVKYYLIYEVGYSNLHSKFNSSDIHFEFKVSEDEAAVEADIKGRVIHKILEEETTVEKLKNRISELISAHRSFSDNKNKYAEESITKTLRIYYGSKVYEQIKNYKNYKNEFEIYTKEDDYYLFGIIDKLVFEGEKINIIDYKTDRLDVVGISDKVENYKTQLIFYSYLVKKLFPGKNNIQCGLVFINEPEKIHWIENTTQLLSGFNKELKNIVNSIRERKFIPNKSHCKNCYFSDEHNICIKK